MEQQGGEAAVVYPNGKVVEGGITKRVNLGKGIALGGTPECVLEKQQLIKGREYALTSNPIIVKGRTTIRVRKIEVGIRTARRTNRQGQTG